MEFVVHDSSGRRVRVVGDDARLARRARFRVALVRAFDAGSVFRIEMRADTVVLRLRE